MNLKIYEDDGVVSIARIDTDDYLDGFIDIYPDDPITPSLFISTEECMMFAEIIVKLLEVFMNDTVR